MNHTKRLLRIAEKILADVHFSTQQEFDEYLKNHPNYRENTKFYVNGVQVKAPPREKNNDGDMTEEQKKLHNIIMKPSLYSPNHFEDIVSISGYKGTHPRTLDIIAELAEMALRRHSDEITNETYGKTFMALTRIVTNPSASEKTLNRIVRSANAYDKVDEHDAYSRKDSLVGDAVSHPNVSENTIYDFYEDYPRRAAQNPNCPQDILEKLSMNDNDNVRFLVFRNPNTPEKIREQLSKDKKVLDIQEEERLFDRAFNPKKKFD